jgi:peptidoglycan hydrolase-like protein with peptidoglycan-binding domain
MHSFVAVLMGSVLWLCPLMVEAGTAIEQPPVQQQVISKDNLKLVQERLRAEGVYAGSLDGEMNAQTEAALRAYQQKRRIPVSGAADPATLKELQIEIPSGVQGESR